MNKIVFYLKWDNDAYIYNWQAVLTDMGESAKRFNKINKLARGKINDQVKKDKKEVGKKTTQMKL